LAKFRVWICLGVDRITSLNVTNLISGRPQFRRKSYYDTNTLRVILIRRKHIRGGYRISGFLDEYRLLNGELYQLFPASHFGVTIDNVLPVLLIEVHLIREDALGCPNGFHFGLLHLGCDVLLTLLLEGLSITLVRRKDCA